MVKGVIFDLDGVLVTTDEMHYRGWKKLAEEEGIPFDRSVNSRQRGVSRMESLEAMLDQAPRAYAQEEKLEMAERKNRYYREFLQTLTPDDALPGAKEMLIELRRRGIKTAIGSSSRNAPLIMKLVGLEGMVDAVVDGNHIKASKPDPEVFLGVWF
jgi:beta-phosphoglucomutase